MKFDTCTPHKDVVEMLSPSQREQNGEMLMTIIESLVFSKAEYCHLMRPWDVRFCEVLSKMSRKLSTFLF